MEPLFRLEAWNNRHNVAVCELYPDRVVLSTRCTGGLIPLYEDREREIPLASIRRVIISNGGIHFFVHHPNAIHFITDEQQRSLDSLFRDPKVSASDYIREGVQQLCPKNEQDLAAKIETAVRIKAYIEEKRKERESTEPETQNP